MQIKRALYLGMCFGVRDAIDAAFSHAARQPLTILGDLVHNPAVLQQLAESGIATAQDPGNVTTPAVMITAHGASDKAIAAAASRGLRVIEATCPLVHFAHRSLKNLVAEGCYPVVVGKQGHVEVRGLTGDLDECSVILREEDLDRVPERPCYGVVAQTTQPVARVAELVAKLRERFPRSEVRFTDTVCQPTKQRQQAAVGLAREADVVIVVGGASSNNTRELRMTCSQFCARVHQVQNAAELRPEWFENAEVVGITAGTSTPGEVIDEVEERIHALRESFAPLGV